MTVTIPEEKRTDHKGVVYPTFRAMCAAWHIGPDTVRHRLIHKGMSLEDALTQPLARRIRWHDELSVDHTGMRFDTVSDMCQSWGISYSCYKYRRNKGMSKGEALTMPNLVKMPTRVDGVDYPCLAAACRAYGVLPGTALSRLDRGMSPEQAITEVVKHAGITGPDGVYYPSVLAMCRAYGISYNCYNRNVLAGMSLKDALTTRKCAPHRPVACTDHTGRKFATIADMCEAWNVLASTFRYRRRHGWSVEEALTKPERE